MSDTKRFDRPQESDSERESRKGYKETFSCDDKVFRAHVIDVVVVGREASLMQFGPGSFWWIKREAITPESEVDGTCTGQEGLLVAQKWVASRYQFVDFYEKYGYIGVPRWVWHKNNRLRGGGDSNQPTTTARGVYAGTYPPTQETVERILDEDPE